MVPRLYLSASTARCASACFPSSTLICASSAALGGVRVAKLRAITDQMGWTVVKIRADDGCYHVLATDRNGQVVKGVFDPQSLKLIGPSDEAQGEKHEHKGDDDAPKPLAPGKGGSD